MIPKSGQLICAAEEIHVWRIVLDRTRAQLNALDAVLSTDERRRASRYATDQLRSRWTTARGALRVILAGYAGTTPERLVIACDANRKPRLLGVGESHFFNLTRTGGLAFVAVSVGGPVGIDAEIECPDVDWKDISRRYFAPAESAAITSLTSNTSVRAFYACWTRKEAYLKTLGIGLRAALDRFQVTVRPDEPACLSWIEGSPDEPGRWSLWDLSEPGVAVALANRAPAQRLRRFSFSLPPV